MSDQPAHAVYTKLLLRRRHGYPLWIPESDSNLPDVVRNKGVSVGDLGILTDDGGFDFLFNVCAESDDPANQGHVPPQFQPLRISSSHAIRKIPGFHCRKSSITSAHVSRTTIAVEGSAEMTPFVTGGGGFEFSTSKAEAAILMLPDGGSRYDTMHRSLFKQYAAENALSWYIYVNSSDHLAREAPNGSLYLVTGCDKARSWMTAAASRSSESHAISVKFAIGPIMEGRIALQTSWNTPYIDADTRIYPDYPDLMPQQDNQCVFMRGFTITVRENSLMQKIRGPVQLKVIGGSSRNTAPSFSSRSPYSSYHDNLAGSPSSEVSSSTGPVDNFGVPDYWTKEHSKESVLEDNVELTDLPGRSTELLNPSARINEHLLTLHSHITVAVTHDEEWMEVTKDLTTDQWPDNCTLAAMVVEKRSGYMISTEDAEGHSGGFPEISHDIQDQRIIRDTDFEHDRSQYLTSPVGDVGMSFNDSTSPYRYNYHLTPSNSLSPASPNTVHTPGDTSSSLPPYSPEQFQGSALPGNSFQSLYISEQPSSASSSIIQPYTYPQPTSSTLQNLPAEFDHLCLLSPLSATESVALSPSPTTSVSSLPDEEQNVGGGLDSLAGKRCTLPANAKRNLRSLPEHSVVGQHRKKINTEKKIREQKFKCTFDGCTKTYTASHNFKDHLMWHRGMRLLCPHRDSGCREDYAQEVSLCRHHCHSHKDCTEHHRRADYVWASKEEISRVAINTVRQRKPVGSTACGPSNIQYYTSSLIQGPAAAPATGTLLEGGCWLAGCAYATLK